MPNGQLALERFAFRFEIDTDREAIELVAAGVGGAILLDQRGQVGIALDGRYCRVGVVIIVSVGCDRIGLVGTLAGELRLPVRIKQIGDRNLGEARGRDRQRLVRRARLGRSNSCCSQRSTQEHR